MNAEAELLLTDAAVAPPAIGWFAWIDRALDRAGDRLNPILVKETRQALKSRQFTITFALLLLCGWVWTILGVAMIGPDIWYGAQGAEMFFGYYMILAFPLLVIVPFGAFRSLAGEQEDRTYELMSITTLGPRQIIRGKLGSVVLQMLVYLSAISPCLAFTYLLRGIDFPTIVFILAYTILASLGLSAIALLISTLSTEKHWQVVLSVLVIAGLLLALWIAIFATGQLISWLAITFNDAEFWQACGAILTGYASYFALVFYAAAAQITFASDNRSTRLRATMFVQHLLLVGWMAWLWIAVESGDYYIVLTFLICIGLHWYVMGVLMSGESSALSSRVKRRLPQSFLGRVFLTWFNPGPGTGFMLAVSCLTAAVATAAAAAATLGELFSAWNLSRWSTGHTEAILAFGALELSYVTIYLGVGLLVVRLLRKVTAVTILLSILLHIMFLLLGCGVPMVIQMMSPQLRNMGYTLLQITNPLWTLGYVADRSSLPPEAPVLLTIVPLAALIVFLLNLPGVAAEVKHVRIAKPRRVAEEDAEMAAEKAPPKPVRTSPWD